MIAGISARNIRNSSQSELSRRKLQEIPCTVVDYEWSEIFDPTVKCRDVETTMEKFVCNRKPSNLQLYSSLRDAIIWQRRRTKQN